MGLVVTLLSRRIKLERATFHLADKSAAFHPRSHRNAVPRTDELNSAVSRMGAEEDDDPFAEAMGEATSRAIEVEQAKNDIRHNRDDSTAARDVNGDDEDEDLEEKPEEDEKQRRLSQTLGTGDVIEEVSTYDALQPQLFTNNLSMLR